LISISHKGNIDVVAIFGLGTVNNVGHLFGRSQDVFAHADSAVNQKSKIQIGQFFLGCVKPCEKVNTKVLTKGYFVT
jgi:hypothetical protein